MKESEIINKLRGAFPRSGLGDDAAVLRAFSGRVLLSADASVESVHYRKEISTLSQVVQKTITSNVSDIFAMAGEPRAVLLTAGLPSGFGESGLSLIIDGIDKGCRYYGIELAGGDTVRSPGPAFFSVSIIGEAPGGKIMTRSGARPGDQVFLSGDCGGSSAGMRILEGLLEGGSGWCAEALLPSEERDRAALKNLAGEISLFTGREDMMKMKERCGLGESAAELLRLMKMHLTPTAAGLDWKGMQKRGFRVTSVIDVSDGIGRDLASLCEESGVGAVIEEECLPVPDIISGLKDVERERINKLVLGSGEEYVLLLTARPTRDGGVPKGLIRIGEITTEEGGIVLAGKGGRKTGISRYGYEHDF